MKKYLGLLLTIIIILSFSGCDTKSNNEKIENSSEVKAIEIKEPTDNSVNGYRISDSKNESVPDFTDTQSKTEESSDTLYYANTNTKKFHYKTCSSANKISNENLYISESRDELIDEGYSPCGRCKP